MSLSVDANVTACGEEFQKLSDIILMRVEEEIWGLLTTACLFFLPQYHLFHYFIEKKNILMICYT